MKRLLLTINFLIFLLLMLLASCQFIDEECFSRCDIEDESPGRGKWKQISPFGSSRIGHTTIWTGMEMIVWGGAGGCITGGIYNPDTDSWTPTSTINTPSQRVGHTAVWTGKEMIIWGGLILEENMTDSGWIFIP